MTLYASILVLNHSDIQALHIRDPYSIHRIVYSLFQDVRSPEEKEGHTGSGILYMDQGPTPTGRTILMLSSRQPADKVRTQNGKFVGVTKVKTISDEFLSSECYQFKVVVNPTRRDNQSKKLIPIREYMDIECWFRERSSKDWGFDVQELSIEGIDVLKFPNKSKQLMTLSHAHIYGRLIVKDRQLFIKAFSTGLGRNSAFGCGLLRLVPCTTDIFKFN